MTFERIVRPFQTTPFTPSPRPAIIVTEEELEDIEFTIGETGSIKTLQGNGSSSITTFHKEESKEISRETTERRVENPDDPSQYVIVEDTDKIEVESGRADTYKNQEIEFKKRS